MQDPKVLYSRNCWVENKIQPAGIFIQGGKIIGIENKFKLGYSDYGESLIMPGLIDAHVHINEPGRTGWEGFETATKAAAAGGITSIIDMPLNSHPVTTSMPAFREKLDASRPNLHVNVGFYGGLVPANSKNLEELLSSGILGIKCFLTHSGIDEFPNVTEEDLIAAMPVISASGIPLLVHCEISDDIVHSDLNDDPTSYSEYLKSRPDDWELKAVKLMLDYSERFNCRVHIVHVSSGESLNLIKTSKQKFTGITAETCPHYLIFSAENIQDGQTIFKCAPPIRSAENNLLLKESFKEKILDFISSDHSPAPPNIKELVSGNFKKAWGGIAGLQFLLPASWTALKNELSLEEFIPLITSKPAEFLGLQKTKAEIKTGYDADLVIWDPQQKFVVEEQQIFHRHKASPYLGLELYGKIISSFVNGWEVFISEKIINQNKGQWLLKK